MRTRPATHRPALPLMLGVPALLLVLAAAYLWLLGATAPPDTRWVLSDDKNRPVSNTTFLGRYELIYFGYARCPDICPATLATMAQAMRRLGPQAARIQPIFISIDPRDTPAALHRYLAAVAPGIIGLTGTGQQLRTVMADYRIDATSQPDGTIDHTSILLLIGPYGQLVAPLSATTTADQLAADVDRLSKEGRGLRPRTPTGAEGPRPHDFRS